MLLTLINKLHEHQIHTQKYVILSNKLAIEIKKKKKKKRSLFALSTYYDSFFYNHL